MVLLLQFHRPAYKLVSNFCGEYSAGPHRPSGMWKTPSSGFMTNGPFSACITFDAGRPFSSRKEVSFFI